MTRTTTREMYIPKNATKVEAKGCAAVFYLYANAQGKPAAKAFVGKALKPTWGFWFPTPAAREKKIADTIAAAKDRMVRVRAGRADRSQPSTLKLGDILYTSWGYDQTNIDFYQVTRLVGPTTVEIREIHSRDVDNHGSHDSSRCVAVPDSFKGEAMTKRVSYGNNITIASYANATPWDGKPKSYSWGH